MTDKQLINEYILQKVKEGEIDYNISLKILKQLNGYKRSEDDIAIIGMSCKFPQADDFDEYWKNIKTGVEAIGTFPEERKKDMGRKVKLKAGWLEHIAGFDAKFFRVSPKEAEMMHPSQRLFLEESWKALEDSGYCNEEIDQANVGVYVGIDHSYQMEYVKRTDTQDLLAMTGSMTSVLASRIAYALNLHGPNLVVDTACSSGLVCTHLACMAIKNNECDMAIAGGLHILSIIDAKFDGVESKNDKLSSFDRNSQGTVWGEGLGFVVLKPLKLAKEDGDHIYAVIKGTAINNDGKTNGITSPSSDTQAEVIEKAWENAKINPENLSYIEAHATGTVLGDPIEVKGLKMAFDKHTKKKQFCAIGSVKPNIGHGVSAASMSSLIKVILALREKKLPPNINFLEPNPYIKFQDSPLYVSDKLKDWNPNGEKRLAGVSSFGFGRTNAHVVIEEAPEVVREEKERECRCVFTVSAKSEQALKAYVDKYKIFIKEHSDFCLEDICYSASIGRFHYNHRLAIIAKDKDDFVKKIEQLDLNQIKDQDIFYGYYKLIAETDEKETQEDITESERRKLNKQSDRLIKDAKTDLDGNLSRICELYIKGANIAWKLIYNDKKYYRMSLPTYPFEHKHYWLPLSKQPTGVQEEKSIHPLIDKRAVSTIDDDIYITTFEMGKQWILTEHLIDGISVIPGTAYVEMILYACHNTSKSDRLVLNDIVFYTPVIVLEEEQREVQTIVSRAEQGYNVKIISQDESGTWITHVVGKVEVLDEEIPERIQVEDIKKWCSQSKLYIDMTKENGGFLFGKRWRNIKDISLGNNKILTEVQIGQEYEQDMEEFLAHPAMLDNAVNVASEILVHKTTENMFLPFTYKKLKLYKKLPKHFYSYQVLKNEIVKGMNTLNIDVVLFDETGEILGNIEKYTIKIVDRKEFAGVNSKIKPIYYHVNYKEEMLSGLSETITSGTVLFIGNNSKQVETIKKYLANIGQNVIFAELGNTYKKIRDDWFVLDHDMESYKKFIKEIDINSISCILHTGSMKQAEEMQQFEQVKEMAEVGIYSAFKLVKALLDEKIETPIEALFLSNHVNGVKDNREIKNPLGASLFAFAKVINHEYNKIHIRCVDVDESTDVATIINSLFSSDKQFLSIYREGKRYIQQLEEFNVDTTPEETIEIKEKGVYVITGSMDGIGLVATKVLSKNRKANIAFICRSELPDRSRWEDVLKKNQDAKLVSRIKSLMEIENYGANVVIYSCDVTDYNGMKKIMDQLRDEFGRIHGVIHGAGIPGNKLIVNKEIDSFKNVLEPKVLGTWILDELTREDNLDFFVMFSSIISFFGLVGQSDYAAANAFLNTFSGYRRNRGGKTTTLQWSVWNEIGMALDFSTEDLRGVCECISNTEGFDAIEMVLQKEVTQVWVGAFDYERLSALDGNIGIELSDKIKNKLSKKKAKRRIEEKERREIKIISKQKLSNTQMHVVNIWASVLGLEEVDVTDSFNDYGGDSIIATQLVNAINQSFPDAIDISDIFTYPTAKQLAKYVEEKMTVNDGDVSTENDYTVEDIMNMIEEGKISVEDADEMILKLQDA